MKTRIAGFTLFTLVCVTASAGGSWEAVKIARFTSTNATDYVLVVELVPRGPTEVQWQDPMFRGCTRLVVHGTFGALRAKGRFAWFQDTFSPPKHADLTKAKHLEAISYLQRAVEEHQIINLGYIGTGFVPVDAEQPCVVASRALEIYNDRGSTAIVSYHNDF
jgi:hypothetical protein